MIAGYASGAVGILILIGGLVMKKSKSKGGIVTLGVLSAVAGAILLALRYTIYKDASEAPASASGGGGLPPHFVPGINVPPGSVTITGATAEKSSPQVNITFSYAGACTACSILFDLTMTYSDGTTASTQATANPLDGYVVADYTPGIRPLPPGPVQISIIAYSSNFVSGTNGPQTAPFITSTP